MARTHVLKGFNDIDAALWINRFHPGLGIQDMVTLCREYKHPVVDSIKFDAAQLLHEWGLAHKQTRSLTVAGEAFYQIWQERRSEAVDLLHGLQYQQWSKLSPEEHPASWYQVCAACLIELEVLPFPLEQAAAAYPQFLAVELASQPKIALLRSAQMEDFC